MWRGTSRMVIILVMIFSTHALINSPPKIMKQPATDEILFKIDDDVRSQKPVVIDCEAESEPNARYRWRKNGKVFDWQAYDDRIDQQPGRGTLVITVPKDEDSGQYQCFAENEFGTATSNTVSVRKLFLNAFKEERPQTLNANEGDPFQLQCQPPDGWPKPNVYWVIENSDGSIKSINNSRITLDPEGNLWFSNITRDDQSDDFYYVCAASSVFFNEYKLGNRVLLIVIRTGVSPTEKWRQPVRQYLTRKNEVALQGKRIELFCIFGGTPLPQIVWAKNGSSIPWSDRITQGNYGKSLIIRHATFEDAGSYTCEASNGVGNAQSYSISLQVLATPYFTIEPEVKNAAEEETIEFRCEASGVPEPTIKWIHNGKPISEAPANSRRIVSTNSIIIRDLVKSDTGNYGCNATNSLGYVYKDVFVNVLALPPEIQEAPRKEATVDGRTVQMRCRVFGAPKPEVKWIHNGLELTGGRFHTLDSGDLEIEEVLFTDAGDYTCYAVNKFGSQQANGSLIVKLRTQITDEPKDYEVAAGTSATFRCNANSDPALNLEMDWWKDGEPIDFDQEARFVKTNDNSLTISKTSELDSGVYTCVAKTELDEASAQATLVVQDVPNAPELLSVECNLQDASISWQPMGDNRSPILHYAIQYSTSFTPDVWEDVYNNIPPVDFTYKVTMSPWANYTFRVIAYNKIGPSNPSINSEFCHTQPDVPYKNPDNVEGMGDNPNNLVISWTPMPQIEHNAPYFHYRVYWKRDIPTEETWQTQEIFDWQENKTVIANQPTFVRYLIKVSALNQEGQANIAPMSIIGWSGENEPLESPTNFTLIQVVSSTAAIFKWSSVSLESVRGHFQGYKIQTWTEEEGEENYREIPVRGDANQALITKFKTFSKNYVRILVYNNRFNGPSSEVLEFYTPEGLPSTVESFKASPLGNSAFMLEWKKPLEVNGILTGYKIYYELINGPFLDRRMEREPHIDDPRVTHAKLGGLKPNSKYRIHIRATTNAGEGDDYFIEKETLWGLREPPSVPDFRWEILHSDTGYKTVRIFWQPNVDNRPGSHFFIKYREKGQSKWILTKSELWEDYQDVRGLDLNAVYEFCVVSVEGDYIQESAIKDINTSVIEGPIIIPNENMETAGWIKGMIEAISVLLILLIIICIIKRNRGGKINAKDRDV